MSFTSWLLKQVGRQDPIGDLALDVKHDPDWPKHLTVKTGYDKIWNYFTEYGACDGAWDALDRAWHEWRNLDPEYSDEMPSWREYEGYGDPESTIEELLASQGLKLTPYGLQGSDPKAEVDIRPHALYRFYGQNDQLLYIGLTIDPGERWKAHSKTKPWWTEVSKTTIEHFPDRESVKRAEKEAIVNERPKYNIQHNSVTAGRA